MASNVKVNDAAWRRLKRRLDAMAKPNGPHVKVGVLASRGGQAQHDSESGMTMIELAAVHEFGSPAAGIPERSFIRRTFREKEKQVVKVTAALAKAVVDGRLSVGQALGQLGAWAAAEVKKTVTAGPHIPPPLKQATIDRKGSDRPLVDTGRLVDSVQWEVVE